MENNNQEEIRETVERPSVMNFDKSVFSRLVVADLSKSKDGRGILKKYKQSEVREFVENYKLERNQI